MFPFFTLQNTSRMPQSDHFSHFCPILQVRSWSKCPFGQWAADEATCGQAGEHLLLLPWFVPSIQLLFQLRSCVTQSVMCVTSCDITRPITAHRQLQLCSHRPSNVNNRTSTARSQYRWPSCPIGLDHRVHITPALKKLHCYSWSCLPPHHLQSRFWCIIYSTSTVRYISAI